MVSAMLPPFGLSLQAGQAWDFCAPWGTPCTQSLSTKVVLGYTISSCSCAMMMKLYHSAFPRNLKAARTITTFRSDLPPSIIISSLLFADLLLPSSTLNLLTFFYHDPSSYHDHVQINGFATTLQARYREQISREGYYHGQTTRRDAQ